MDNIFGVRINSVAPFLNFIFYCLKSTKKNEKCNFKDGNYIYAT